MTGLPLTISALIVTMLLMPGIAFVAGLLLSPLVNRDSSSLSTPITLAIVLFWSIFSNLIAGTLIAWTCPVDGASTAGCAVMRLATYEGHVPESVLIGLAVVLCVSVVSFGCGKFITERIERGTWRTEFLHGWAYDYVSDRRARRAFVLTKIGDAMQRVGYEGTLHTLKLGTDGTVRMVRLTTVSRFRVDFSQAMGERRTRIDPSPASRWSSTDLWIPGEHIENLAIRTIGRTGAIAIEDARGVE